MTRISRTHAFAFAILALTATVSPRVLQSVPTAHATTRALARVPTSAPQDLLAGVEPALENLPCPAGMLADNGACVRLPDDESWGEDPVGSPESEPTLAGHHEKSGRWFTYEQIPRRPDRPADYDAYVYPVAPGLPGGRHVVSGYDLDLPDAAQRRGRMRAVGHGGVDIPQKRGTPIRLVALDHQVGDAEVLHVGRLMGESVVTRHTLREGGRTRDYVLIFGHIDAAAPGLIRGTTLRAGDLVGIVGDTGSPELVHLHLEARRVRDGIDASKLTAARILAADATIVCDPRNVLPLKG